MNFEKFKLTSNVITLTGTYGLTDRFDVNLLLPVVYTDMDVRGVATIDNTTQPPIHFFDNATRDHSASALGERQSPRRR